MFSQNAHLFVLILIFENNFWCEFLNTYTGLYWTGRYKYNSTNTKRREKILEKILTSTGFEPTSPRLSRPGSLTIRPRQSRTLSTILSHHIMFIRTVYPGWHLWSDSQTSFNLLRVFNEALMVWLWQHF